MRLKNFSLLFIIFSIALVSCKKPSDDQKLLSVGDDLKLLDNVSEEDLINTAIKLKEKNNCNLTVANDLENIRKGNHKAFIIKPSNDYIIASGKEDIAEKLIGELFKNDKL